MASSCKLFNCKASLTLRRLERLLDGVTPLFFPGLDALAGVQSPLGALASRMPLVILKATGEDGLPFLLDILLTLPLLAETEGRESFEARPELCTVVSDSVDGALPRLARFGGVDGEL